MKTYKNPIALILLAVVLFFGIGGITDSDVDVVPEQTSVDTSDWVTYVNEELGFELKHPEGWETNEMTGTNITRVIFAPQELPLNERGWWVARYDMDGSDSLDTYIKNLESELQIADDGVNTKFSKTEYLTHPAFILEITETGEYVEKRGTLEIIYIKEGGHIWTWPIDTSGTESNVMGDFNIADYQGLIDTFKFK